MLGEAQGKSNVSSTANNIIIQSILSEQISHSCRICLMEGKEILDDKKELISPCNCIGSLKYVHQTCLSIWMKQKFKPDELKVGINEKNCELCNGIINYKVKVKSSCRSCQELKKKIKGELFSFVTALIFLIGFLTLIGFFIQSLVENRHIQESFLISVAVLSFVLLLLFFFYFVRKFLRKYETKIIPLHKKKENDS